MKKIALAGISALAAIAASAQISVVKEAERAPKEDYKGVIKILTPAFTNPETANTAYPWYVAGKAGVNYYTDQYLLQSIGKKSDKAGMSHALMDAMGYFEKALPLDSLPDAKGKVKPKYSKDIIKLVKENYTQLNSAAVNLWDEKDYQGAFDAWEIFLSVPENPVFNGAIPAIADSTAADIRFNQGLAAWQMDSLEMSLRAFEKSVAKGYNKPQVFDYAINHAARLGQNDRVYELAEQAYKIHGNANPLYLQLVINGRIDKQQYDEAAKMLDDAIAVSPGDAQLYNIKGVLYESKKDNDQARQYYAKAVEIDPQNGQAQYNLGRQICNEAYAINDEAVEKNLPTPEYNKLRENKINPLFREAAEHLEAGLKADPDNRDIRVYLRNVYYNLGDEENLKRIEDL